METRTSGSTTLALYKKFPFCGLTLILGCSVFTLGPTALKIPYSKSPKTRKRVFDLTRVIPFIFTFNILNFLTLETMKLLSRVQHIMQGDVIKI